MGNLEFFKDQNIYAKFKAGPRGSKAKVPYADNGILQLKKILYRMLHETGNRNWPSYLKSATNTLNNRHLDGIGGLTPNDIKSSFDDVKIDAAKGGFKTTSNDILNLNNTKYKKDSTKLQIGSYVYARTKQGVSGPFARGFKMTVI